MKRVLIYWRQVQRAGCDGFACAELFNFFPSIVWMYSAFFRSWPASTQRHSVEDRVMNDAGSVICIVHSIPIPFRSFYFHNCVHNYSICVEIESSVPCHGILADPNALPLHIIRTTAYIDGRSGLSVAFSSFAVIDILSSACSRFADVDR